MNCLFCKEEFTPKYNYNIRQLTRYCSRTCIARANTKKLIRFPLLRDKDWLFDQYWIKKRSMKEISLELKCAESRIYVSMDRMGITRRSIGKSLLGKKKSLQHRINLSESAKNRWRGENNPNWRGGFGRLTIQARQNRDYELWRREVKLKYNDQCANCKKDLSGKCNCCGQPILGYVHHIKSVELYPELVVDPNNGILLCYTCHLDEHKLTPDKLG